MPAPETASGSAGRPGELSLDDVADRRPQPVSPALRAMQRALTSGLASDATVERWPSGTTSSTPGLAPGVSQQRAPSLLFRVRTLAGGWLRPFLAGDVVHVLYVSPASLASAWRWWVYKPSSSAVELRTARERARYPARPAEASCCRQMQKKNAWAGTQCLHTPHRSARHAPPALQLAAAIANQTRIVASPLWHRPSSAAHAVMELPA
ncbi:hypothetical protein K491DRAFT_718658 [Lophiostoma macrostomum CBS 122681]|uniref:Uncharacterized protein n=1 Tax=Lophiostoma macrostomum CBS 122681 TaxID=1314788 RepID=A0A6A6T1F4_9PLEO|nr:hypothetical protein K491DRAFT_718658 [Lophiostoma macrostomum CBS 122681]